MKTGAQILSAERKSSAERITARNSGARPLISGRGKLQRRWHVVCGRCTDWDIPSGTRTQAEETIRASGWTLVAGRWYCRQCSVAVGI